MGGSRDAEGTTSTLHGRSWHNVANSDPSGRLALEHPYQIAKDICTVQDRAITAQSMDNRIAPGGSCDSSGADVDNHRRGNEGQYIRLTKNMLDQHEVQLQAISGHCTLMKGQAFPQEGLGKLLVIPAFGSSTTEQGARSSLHGKALKSVSEANSIPDIASQGHSHGHDHCLASSCKLHWQQSYGSIQGYDADGDIDEPVGGLHSEDPSQVDSMYKDRRSTSYIDLGLCTRRSAKQLTAWGDDLAGIGCHLDDYYYPENAADLELVID